MRELIKTYSVVIQEKHKAKKKFRRRCNKHENKDQILNKMNNLNKI